MKTQDGMKMARLFTHCKGDHLDFKRTEMFNKSDIALVCMVSWEFLNRTNPSSYSSYPQNQKMKVRVGQGV